MMDMLESGQRDQVEVVAYGKLEAIRALWKDRTSSLQKTEVIFMKNGIPPTAIVVRNDF